MKLFSCRGVAGFIALLAVACGEHDDGSGGDSSEAGFPLVPTLIIAVDGLEWAASRTELSDTTSSSAR